MLGYANKCGKKYIQPAQLTTEEEKIAELKKALEGSDVEEIKNKTKELNDVAMKLATKVYEAASKEQQASETTEENTDSKNDNVEEASYEEK